MLKSGRLTLLGFLSLVCFGHNIALANLTDQAESNDKPLSQHAACLVAYRMVTADTATAFPHTPTACTISTPRPNWKLLRATLKCGGDSCANVVWLWNPNGQRYYFNQDHANGSILILWDGSFFLSEQITQNADMRYRLSLVMHEFESHPTPFADCGSPSLSTDNKWLWCRQLDGSTWRLSLANYNGTKKLEKVAEYQGDQPLYVVPYAWIVPPAVTFEKSGFASIRYEVQMDEPPYSALQTQYLELTTIVH